MAQTSNLAPPPLTSRLSGQDGMIDESGIWPRWLNRVQQLVNTLISTPTIGNGALANIQAPAKSTGGGPVNPNLVAAWVEETRDGTTYWRPLFQ